MIATLLLLLHAAFAAATASVVEAPVAGPTAVTADRLALRVSWTGGGIGRVEVQQGTRWRPAAPAGPSPVTTHPVAIGALVRVVVGGQASDAVRAAGVWTPGDVAAWSGAGLRGARVVALDERDGRLWAATAGGGVAAWDGHEWIAWDRRSGLPSDVATGVAAAKDGTWVATRAGLVRLGAHGVERTWTTADGLPSDVAVAVQTAGQATWVATAQGLARIDPDGVHTVLAGHCDALLHGPGGRTWAACPALTDLDGHPVPGADPDLHVLDVATDPQNTWLATATHGVLRLDGGVAFPEWRPKHGAVYALAATTGGLVAAAGQDGLWQRRDEDWVRHGLADGLPSPTALSVHDGPVGKVWVGTDRGVALFDLAGRATALPLAPLPAGEAVAGTSGDAHGLAVAAEDGLVWLGHKPPRGWDALVAAVDNPPAAVQRIGADWWVLDGASALHLDRRGHLRRWRLPDWGTALAQTAKGVALATVSGVQIWLPGATQLSAAIPVADVRAVHTGWDGGLWIAGRDVVVRLGLDGQRTWKDIAGPRDVATTPSAAWVAADGGLYRIDASGGAKRVSQSWKAGSFVAVASFDNAVWAAGADGRLWGPSPAHPGVVDLHAWLPGARVQRLVAVARGVWVATDQGLFFVDSRVPR